MNAVRRLVPQPYVSGAIFLLWMVLVSAFTPGHVLLAAVLALATPLATAGFWPRPPRAVRPLVAMRLFVRVILDIVIANWQVARLVVGPIGRLKPDFVDVPLSIDDPFVCTILASIVSLAPGTVFIDVDTAQRVLRIHALNVPDRSTLIATIKSRYEAPLKEIFAC